MVKEKRTKPCSNCKKSKVKCVYTDSLPCDRCLKIGQAVNCQFIAKLPSLVLPEYESTVPSVKSVTAPVIDQAGIDHTRLATDFQPHDTQWKSSLENKINTFDNKLNDLVDIMKQQQQFLIDQQRLHQNLQIYPQLHPQIHPQIHSQVHSQVPQIHSQAPHSQSQIQMPVPMLHSQNQLPSQSTYSFPYPSQQFKPQILPPQPTKSSFLYSPTPSESPYLQNQKLDASPSLSSILPPLKKLKPNESQKFPKDFRDGYLSKDQAQELFAFFNSNISQQLFGFEISKISVDSIWSSCPILVCAISTIASIHHPIHSRKSKQLLVYLHELSGSLILKGKPKSKEDGFNTIVALILCSFWLSDSQMFTGLALQLAKEYGLNNPYTKQKDDLKLWYLLYILDGQQSLTFNRQPILDANDYSFKNSREILLNSTNHQKLTAEKSKKLLQNGDENTENNQPTDDDERKMNELIEHSSRFTDLRLVSQVEYNQAINEAFKGNAWELLAPSSFGIPSRSNMELDRWMVSWTVLLAPGNHGAVWSSKSTLIYYNFAKMSINSTAVRRLTVNPNEEDEMLPKWSDVKEESRTPSASQCPPKEEEEEEDEFSSDDEFEDDDEFISSSKLVVQDDAIVSGNIAINAASTVLHLVTTDSDIQENLKYVPVHIHIMIYYAALLLLNPPLESKDKSQKFNPQEHYTKTLANLRLIKSLQKKIYANLPIDTKFGDKLIQSLNDMVFEKLKTLKSEITELEDKTLRLELLQQVNSFHENENTLYEMVDSSGVSSSGSTPKPEKISAWPGSHHGHP